MASILDRIEATPAQERAVASALADFEKAARRSGDGLRGARRSVAEAFRADSFDEIRLADVLTSLDTAQDGVRKAALDAFARIHGALDERQRSMVADLLEHPWRVHDGGPYRGSDFGGVGDFG